MNKVASNERKKSERQEFKNKKVMWLHVHEIDIKNSI